MLIISREDAIQQRKSRYFTGQPCKRGHLAERYTVNTGCLECVKPLGQIAFDRDRKKLINAARSKMIQQGFNLHPSDVDFFTACVQAKMMARDTSLNPEDAISKRKSLPRGICAVRFFWIFESDRPSLTALALSLESSHGSAYKPLSPVEPAEDNGRPSEQSASGVWL